MHLEAVIGWLMLVTAMATSTFASKARADNAATTDLVLPGRPEEGTAHIQARLQRRVASVLQKRVNLYFDNRHDSIEAGSTSSRRGSSEHGHNSDQYQVLQRLCRTRRPPQEPPQDGDWMVVVSRSFTPKPNWVLIAGKVVRKLNGGHHWAAREYYVHRDRRDPRQRSFYPTSRELHLDPGFNPSALRALTKVERVAGGMAIKHAMFAICPREGRGGRASCDFTGVPHQADPAIDEETFVRALYDRLKR